MSRIRTYVTPIYCMASYDGIGDEDRFLARCLLVDVDLHPPTGTRPVLLLDTQRDRCAWGATPAAAAQQLRRALPRPAPGRVQVVTEWPVWLDEIDTLMHAEPRGMSAG